MKHQVAFCATCVLLGCTYKEYYNTYNQGPLSDASVSEPNEPGAGGTGGTAGAGGSSGGGDGGSQLAGSGGGGALVDADCTGCVRLRVVAGTEADYRLDLGGSPNLRDDTVLWRVRVRDYVGEVTVTGYVKSGDGIEEERNTGDEPLNTDAGWQVLGINLANLPAFVPTSFVDGGDAGTLIVPGFPFDKTSVESVGVRVRPRASGGRFTPAIVELDAVSFSETSSRNVDFAVNDGGFSLVEPDTATVTYVAP